MTSLSRGIGCTEVFRVAALYHRSGTGTAVMMIARRARAEHAPRASILPAMERTPEPRSQLDAPRHREL